MNIIDFPTQRKLPDRTAAIRAVVLHTTGETDLDKILAFYQSPDGYQPHYMIETIGTVRRIAAENLVAYHAAHQPAEQAAYEKGYSYWSTRRWNDKTSQADDYGKFFPGYTGWGVQWHSQGLTSPNNLVTGAHPNMNSIGIELQQPEAPTADIYTDEQYIALNELLSDIISRYQMPRNRNFILGHYDVGPMRRTTDKTPSGWDPGGRFAWSRVL